MRCNDVHSVVMKTFSTQTSLPIILEFLLKEENWNLMKQYHNGYIQQAARCIRGMTKSSVGMNVSYENSNHRN